LELGWRQDHRTGDHGVFSFTIEKNAGVLHMYGKSPGGGWVDVTGSYCK
jgi:hypothetical protein